MSLCPKKLFGFRKNQEITYKSQSQTNNDWITFDRYLSSKTFLSHQYQDQGPGRRWRHQWIPSWRVQECIFLWVIRFLLLNIILGWSQYLPWHHHKVDSRLRISKSSNSWVPQLPLRNNSNKLVWVFLTIKAKKWKWRKTYLNIDVLRETSTTLSWESVELVLSSISIDGFNSAIISHKRDSEFDNTVSLYSKQSTKLVNAQLWLFSIFTFL